MKEGLREVRCPKFSSLPCPIHGLLKLRNECGVDHALEGNCWLLHVELDIKFSVRVCIRDVSILNDGVIPRCKIKQLKNAFVSSNRTI